MTKTSLLPPFLIIIVLIPPTSPQEYMDLPNNTNNAIINLTIGGQIGTI